MLSLIAPSTSSKLKGSKNIYGGTYNLLAHTLVDFGVTTTFVDPFNLEEVEGAIKDNTCLLYTSPVVALFSSR